MSDYCYNFNHLDFTRLQPLPFVNTEFSEDELQRIKRFNVLGDGNCFPRAILVALGYDDRDHLMVRQLIVEELNTNYQYYHTEVGYNSVELADFLATSAKANKWFSTDLIPIVANTLKVCV
jgi:hypothetical protein